MKATKDEQRWRARNGIPTTASITAAVGKEAITVVNNQIKKYGLRIRSKQRRGDVGYTHVWVEKIPEL